VPPKPGESHECLELRAKLSKPIVMCFDTKTNLRVLQTGVHSTPQGDVPYTVLVGSWRDVSGVKMPFWEQLTAGPMTMEADTLDVVFDEPLRDSMFQMPKPGSPPVDAAKTSATAAGAEGTHPKGKESGGEPKGKSGSKE
jgi:hypothetical protein